MYYKLIGKKVEKASREEVLQDKYLGMRWVKKTRVGMPFYTTAIDIDILTAFLAIQLDTTKDAAPLLFDTRISGGKLDGYQQRYRTYAEAEKGHRIAVLKVKRAIRDTNQKKHSS